LERLSDTELAADTRQIKRVWLELPRSPQFAAYRFVFAEESVDGGLRP
jgi:hypothetical protein